MNATRAATIRLRSSFDGAVSLGRVQTPTLAIIAAPRGGDPRVQARGRTGWSTRVRPTAASPAARYEGRFHDGAQPRLQTRRGGRGDRRRRARPDRRDHQAREVDQEGARAAALRPHLAPARGQHALRLLRAAHARRRAAALRGAQGAHLPAHELPLPHRRHGRRDQADRRARRRAARVRPGRGLRDRARPAAARPRRQRRQGHRPPRDHPDQRAEHHVDKMSDDDQRIYDMVARRFLAVFHPDAVFENTRVETTVARARLPHPRQGPDRAGLARRLRRGLAEERTAADDDEGADQQLPQLEQGEAADTREVGAGRRRPSRRGATRTPRCSRAMETAGKLVDDDELREAMKDSGHRHARHPRRDHRAPDRRRLRRARRPRAGRHREGPQRDPPARRAPAHVARADRRLGAAARPDRARRGVAGALHEATSPASPATVAQLDATLKDVRIPRANLGPCPVCGHDIVENRKGYSCWSREDPGCGFVIWKSKAGKTLPHGGRQGAHHDRPHREAGHRLQGPHGRRSAPASRWSRARRASGASSSTSPGRARAPSRPRGRRRRRRSPRSPARRATPLLPRRRAASSPRAVRGSGCGRAARAAGAPRRPGRGRDRAAMRVGSARSICAAIGRVRHEVELSVVSDGRNEQLASLDDAVRPRADRAPRRAGRVSSSEPCATLG